MDQLTRTMMMGAGGKKARVSSMSIFAAPSSTGSTITVPAYANPGDFAVLIDFATAATLPSDVAIPGWTNLGGGFHTDTRNFPAPARWNFFAKVLESGDLGSTLTGMNATTMRKLLILYGFLDNPINSVSPGSIQGSSIRDTTLTLDSGASPMIQVGFSYWSSSEGGVTWPAAWSTVSESLSNFKAAANFYPPPDEVAATSTTQSGTAQRCTAVVSILLT